MIESFQLQSRAFQQTRFTQRILEKNHWDDRKISEWMFAPGMVFGSMDKWWGDAGKRKLPHEGLDLCLYQGCDGRIHSLEPATLIPAMFDGRVMKIMKDFLGMTMIMEHDPMDESDGKFLTIYGHANPAAGMETGCRVKQGDIVCSISWSAQIKTPGLVPHLHMTAGRCSSKLPYDRLDWDVIPATPLLTLLDPMPLLDWPSGIQEAETSSVY
jgi:hypothetical protein